MLSNPNLPYLPSLSTDKPQFQFHSNFISFHSNSNSISLQRRKTFSHKPPRSLTLPYLTLPSHSIPSTHIYIPEYIYILHTHTPPPPPSPFHPPYLTLPYLALPSTPSTPPTYIYIYPSIYTPHIHTPPPPSFLSPVFPKKTKTPKNKNTLAHTHTHTHTQQKKKPKKNIVIIVRHKQKYLSIYQDTLQPTSVTRTVRT